MRKMTVPKINIIENVDFSLRRSSVTYARLDATIPALWEQ
jgi:hypothetical protein